MHETCNTCKFLDTRGLYCRCRRNAPRARWLGQGNTELYNLHRDHGTDAIENYMDASWPHVDPEEDWCGEHQQRAIP
jgi:hypothetical protein